MNRHTRTCKLGAKNDPRTPFACLGWEDARLDRPFRYDVSENMALAMTYENARLRVLTLRTLSLPVPAWNAAHTVPPKVRGAILRVAEANADSLLSGGLATIPTGPRRWLPAEAGAPPTPNPQNPGTPAPMFTISDPALFCAAVLCTGKEQTRPYLHGVYIQPATGGGILLTATDGHRLFHGFDPNGAAPAPAIIVPEKAKLPAPWSKPGPLSIDLAAGVMRHPSGGTMGARQDDGRFPDYNRVIPQEFTGEASHFNASYVGDLGDVADILAKGAQPFIVHNAGSAALVLFGDRRDCFGLLMPLRGVADTSKPELPKAAV